MLFAPLLDLYFGQKTTIALWLCLHLFLHFRQRLLYVLLPVSGFMKKSHSCFAFFDNLGIVKTPFTCLNRERHFAPPYLQINFHLSLGRQRKRSKINPLTNIFLLPLHLLEPGTLFWGVFLKNLYFLTFTPLLIWTRVPKCTPIFLIFKKFYLPTHLFKPGEPFCTPPKRKSFRK